MKTKPTDYQKLIGRLVYFDSFFDLVPCKIIAVHIATPTNGQIKVSFLPLATRGPYKRGILETSTSISRIIPREAVYTTNRQKYIKSYSWNKILA